MKKQLYLSIFGLLLASHNNSLYPDGWIKRFAQRFKNKSPQQLTDDLSETVRAFNFDPSFAASILEKNQFDPTIKDSTHQLTPLGTVLENLSRAQYLSISDKKNLKDIALRLIENQKTNLNEANGATPLNKAIAITERFPNLPYGKQIANKLLSEPLLRLNDVEGALEIAKKHELDGSVIETLEPEIQNRQREKIKTLKEVTPLAEDIINHIVKNF